MAPQDNSDSPSTQTRHRQGTAAPGDAPMQAYLQDLNLQQLDLSDIELEDPAPWVAPIWVRGAVAVGAVIFCIWLGNTSFYQLHEEGRWLLFTGLAIAAWAALPLVLLGVQKAQGGSNLSWNMPELRVPAAWTRWLLLVGGLALAGFILFGMPHEAEWLGHGYSYRWFLAVGAALTAGIFLGRWLIMQAEHQRETARVARQPVEVPPWFKWVTLGIIVAAGIFAAGGHRLLSGDSESNRFATSGVGFVVGIMAAIWLAHRFDETEASIKKRKRAEKMAAPPYLEPP